MDTKKIASSIPAEIPEATLTALAEGLEARPHGDLILRGRLLIWLYRQPNISQGGISISYSEAQRASLLAAARRLFRQAGAEEELEALGEGVTYGYRGARL